jgi:hypothetical protein
MAQHEKNRFNYGWVASLGGGIAAIALLLTATPGQAAQEVVFRYGILRQRLAVSELTDFAQGKETSPVMQRYLNRTNSDPAEVRRILNEPITMDPSLLDRLLKNPAGNLMLNELGQMIQTPDNQENPEALRTALVKSATADNQVTLLETIQNYPTDEIHLDVKRMIRTYSRVRKPAQEAITQFGNLRDILKKQGITIPKL